VRPARWSLWLVAAACTVHPPGEDEERARAAAAGAAWQRPFAERPRPVLRADSPLEEYMAFAEQQNGDFEAAYHKWVAALEQVPQDGTQPTTAAVGLVHRFDGGSALDRTGLSLASDAMNNLVAPGRLGSQAMAALERARVAAAEFDRSRLRLQREVAEAFYALAGHDGELELMLQQRILLDGALPGISARVQAGTASGTELLMAQIALDRVDAERERMHIGRPALLAALRRAIGADAAFADATPALPPLEPVRATEQAFVDEALAHNPDLAVRVAEHAAALAEVASREWRNVPELSLASVLTGDGAFQLAGAVTLPFLRSAAIDGAIAQAGALARAAEALRRQAGTDATAQALAGLAALRGQEQEATVLQERLLPHIRQLVDLARSEWTAGTGAYSVLTDAEAQALDAQRALLRVRAEHAVGRARLREATGALLLPPPVPPVPQPVR